MLQLQALYWSRVADPGEGGGGGGNRASSPLQNFLVLLIEHS